MKAQENMGGKQVRFERISPADNGAARSYMKRMVGRESVLSLLRYEAAMLFFAPIPGAFGYLLRRIAYGRLLGSMGEKVCIGASVSLRCPSKIFLGDGAIIDEYVALDAKSERSGGIYIGRKTILERCCYISTGYEGSVKIGDSSAIGVGTQIYGAGGIEIGKGVLVAGGSTIVTVDHVWDDLSSPIYEQGSIAKPIAIEDGAWLGAGCRILGGAMIGRGAVIGAGAVVTKPVPDYAIAAGVPARVVSYRGDRI